MRQRLTASAGFTLIEVMVALIVVALGLTALMVAVSGAARTTGYLRDKTLAEWIAMNRLTEVRLNTSKFGQNTDNAEVKFANRTWHYDTRYFDTSFASMKRVVVRVWPGDAKTKGNPLAEATTFLGAALNPPGTSNAVDWTHGQTPQNSSGTNGAGQGGTTPITASPAGTNSTGVSSVPITPNGTQ